MIQLENISIQYPNRHVLQDAQLTLRRGNLYLLNGPSGCGKTTLIDILSLKKSCKEGFYHFESLDVYGLQAEDKASFIKNHISVMYQNSQLLSHFTVQEQLDFIKQINGFWTGENEIIEKLKLKPLLKKSIGKLSGGEKQRVAFACAYLKKATMYLFDEPTAALHEDMKRTIASLIEQLAMKDCFVVVVTHEETYFHDYQTITIEDEKIKVSGDESKVEVLNLSLEKKHNHQLYTKLCRYFFFSTPVVRSLWIFLMSISIFLSALLMAVAVNYFDLQAGVKDTLDVNEVVVINDYEGIGNGLYDTAQFALNEAIVDKIESIDNVSFIAPYEWFGTAEDGLVINNNDLVWDYPFDEVTVVDNNKEIKTISYRQELGDGYDTLYISPTYDHQSFDDRCDTLQDVEGIYITPKMASALGIKDLNQTKLRFEIGVPVAETPSIVSEVESTEFIKARHPVLQPHKVEVPIRGILNSENYLFYQGKHAPKIFMPYDLMKQIKAEAISEAKEAVEYLKTQPCSDDLANYFDSLILNDRYEANQYIVSVKDENKLNDTLKEIMQLDASLVVHLTTKSNIADLDGDKSTASSTLIYGVVICLIVCTACGIVWTLKIRHRKNEVLYLNHIGLSKKELTQLLKKETFCETVCISLFVCLITISFQLFYRDQTMLIGSKQILLYGVGLGMIIISWVIAFLSGKRSLKYDLND